MVKNKRIDGLVKKVIQTAITNSKVKKVWNMENSFIVHLSDSKGKIMFMPPTKDKDKFTYGLQSTELGIWEGKITTFKNSSNVIVGAPKMIMAGEALRKFLFGPKPGMNVEYPDDVKDALGLRPTEVLEQKPVEVEQTPKEIRFEDIAWTEA